ncbi:MAG: hypothetical protein JAY64_19770, partial [Candidatus Thiodiazotropha weberae]|nr:hypothetical protein [Candidatus Thiodiazotropha lotti]MCW4213398.1 hypothetical protein [Candidatus Thiodiazotropha lotti]
PSPLAGEGPGERGSTRQLHQSPELHPLPNPSPIKGEGLLRSLLNRLRNNGRTLITHAMFRLAAIRPATTH